MTGVVFDSSAVVTFLIQDRGWQGIGNVLNSPALTDGVLAGPALTETIEVARRRGNQSSGSLIWATLASLGLRVEHPTETDLIRAAELLELSDANPGPPNTKTGAPATLSLGDALILAIAERLDYRVLTRDRYWKWMVDNGLLNLTVVIPD